MTRLSIKRASFVALASLLSMPITTAALAQEALPDVATIALPDVSIDGNPKAAKEGYKFFFFQNPDVSFAEAYADLVECRSFLVVGPLSGVPGFRPWVEPVRREIRPNYSNPYGIVGTALNAIIAPKIERGSRNNRMRRCMEPRGYKRFALPEAAWEQINKGDEKAILLMQAKLASGPTPTAGEVRE